MKKVLSKLTAVLVVAFAFLGIGTVALARTGYITWNATPQYNQALENMADTEAGIQDLKAQKDNLIVERDNLVTQLDEEGQANEQLQKTISDKTNQISSLEQTIADLQEQVAGGMTTQGQLEQATKDMSHVEERSQEVLDSLK